MDLLPSNLLDPGSEALLVAAVFAVGVLHTLVPDHWVPITLIARQQGWTQRETARAALQAGTGHVVSTLILAGVVWLAGAAVATRFGQAIDTVSSVALIGFGAWIAIVSWRELKQSGHGHSHGHGHGHHSHHEHAGHSHETGNASEEALYAPVGDGMIAALTHAHLHRHGEHGMPHAHKHDHVAGGVHAITADTTASPPLHDHKHKLMLRTALLIILGSSPMVEGIPAFFAAGKYGVALIILMCLVFAASTIATYVILCTYSTARLQRVKLGAFERYGEVLSGAFIALVGLAFWIWPPI